jgi:hypothetical protein
MTSKNTYILRNATPPVRNPLTTAQKQSLFLAAAINKDIYDSVHNAKINIDYFLELDTALYLLWKTTDSFVQRNRKIPTSAELRIELDAAVNNPQDPAPDNIVVDIVELVEKLETLTPDTVITPETAKIYLSNLIEDKVWRDIRQLGNQPDVIPVGIREAIGNTLTDLAKSDTLTTRTIDCPFPDGYDAEKSLKVIPYGLPLIDVYLGGGSVAGEVYCLLGPTGSCKTTLAQQLSESMALLQVSKWEHTNRRGSLGVVYFVSYELPREIILARAIAHVAQIDFNVLLKKVPLSVPGALNARDKTLFQQQLTSGLYVPSEMERKRSAEVRLNYNWRLLDFSGMDRNKEHIGGGGLVEVMHYIDADMENYANKGLKRHVSGIFVDYIGMMARRYCTVQNKDMSRELRICCLSSIDEARRHLAAKFHCPVLLTHQLNAQGSSLAPGVIADKRYSAESNGVAENCDFIFVVSNLTKQHRIGRINCQKQRRFEGLKDTLIQVQGQFAQVINVENFWVWNDDTHDFSRRHTTAQEQQTKTSYDGQIMNVFSLIDK